MTTALLAFALLSVKFQGPAQELLDLSEDEQWVLARGRRIVNCKAGNGKCAIPLLAVYNAATGKQASMWEGEESSYINVARFLPDNGVQAAFTNLRTGTALLQWEWKAGTKPQITQLSSENMALHCILDNTGGILISGPHYFHQLACYARCGISSSIVVIGAETRQSWPPPQSPAWAWPG